MSTLCRTKCQVGRGPVWDDALRLARLLLPLAPSLQIHWSLATTVSPLATSGQTLLRRVLPVTHPRIPHELQGPILYFRTFPSATASSRGVGEPGSGEKRCQRPNEARSWRPSPILFFTGEAIPTDKSPVSSKMIPRQPFLATSHWSSCLVGPGAIGAEDDRFASSSGQSCNACPFSFRPFSLPVASVKMGNSSLVFGHCNFQRPEIRLETRRFLGRRPEFLAVCQVVVFKLVAHS